MTVTKTCPVCKTEFETPYLMKKYDKFECAKQVRDKQNRSYKKKTKKTKTRKSTPLPKLKKKLQIVFNRWIRERDKNKGCISCGGKIDHAGHYVSQGSCSYLRYDEDNVHGQCMPCNNFKHGNLINYRIGLIKRIGEEAVIRLEESQNIIHKWKRHELVEMIAKYE